MGIASLVTQGRVNRNNTPRYIGDSRWADVDGKGAISLLSLHAAGRWADQFGTNDVDRADLLPLPFDLFLTFRHFPRSAHRQGPHPAAQQGLQLAHKVIRQ